ncbi:hypothetical protein M231_05538 [Tremella mesenterica]|uniref:Cyclin N-terminal domain-containing protein n=1 Tax=Tremella mesenterica TaxID=5217 RepID=A0A4Q1BHS1_TREME|nr:hypothetical protein M231_05538 [Tremella mesenterica]
MDYMYGKPDFGASIGVGAPLSLRPERAVATAKPRPPPVFDPTLATPELFDPVRGRRTLKPDMNMAKKGSFAGTATVQTPLAAHIAGLLVHIWFGRFPQIRPNTPSRNIPNSLDLSPNFTSPINPLQFQPAESFINNVARILQVTLVSHSVSVISLLYVYRIKTMTQLADYPLPQGSEWGVFVTSLILANKYLDDNTYTNATWAELSGYNVKTINLMEAEFLQGLTYSLTVNKEDYEHWNMILEGFVHAKERENALNRSRLAYSPYTIPQAGLYTPQSIAAPTIPIPGGLYRARTASPAKTTPYGSVRASPEYPRKRSAVDAFAGDLPSSSTSVMEQMRLPSRKAGFTHPVTPNYADVVYGAPVMDQQGEGSGLGRSSSLNRQIARFPHQLHGRRGSVGHVPAPTPANAPQMPQQLPPMQHAMDVDISSGQRDLYSALTSAFASMQLPANVPPEHLVFYTIAADPHPGQDGAPRKGILHYQEAFPMYPPDIQPYAMPPRSAQYSDYSGSEPAQSLRPSPIARFTHSSHATPYHNQSPYIPDPIYLPPPPSSATTQTNHDPEWQRAEPMPAQFANAGPPGYTYNPWRSHDYNEGSQEYNEEEAIWGSTADDAYLPGASGGVVETGLGIAGINPGQRPMGETRSWHTPPNRENDHAERFGQGYW